MMRAASTDPLNPTERTASASLVSGGGQPRAERFCWNSRFIVDPVDLFLLRDIEELALAHLEVDASAGRSVLDIGCGEGSKTESLRRMGFEAHGIDVHEPSLNIARSRFPSVRFACGDAQRLPYATATFDAVFSCSALQYVDAKVALAEAARVLKPGGRGVFIVNLGGNPLARAYRGLRRSERYPPHMRPRHHLRLHELPDVLPRDTDATVVAYNLSNSLLHTICMIHETVTASPKVVLRPDRMHRVLSAIDRRLLQWMPALRNCCWSACLAIERRRTT